jgi:uncharacterized membrane protein YfcA
MWEAFPSVFGGMAAGAAGGTLSGLFGVGGGFVMVPLLAVFLGLDQHRAQGATLAVIAMPVGLPGIFQYIKKGIEWDIRIVGYVIVGFLGCVSLGSSMANMVPSMPLRIGFMGFLVCVAFYGWFRKENSLGMMGQGASQGVGLPRSESLILPSLVIGVLGGITSGLTGLGGAVVMIPLLIHWFRMPQHQAQLTSLLILLPPIGMPGVIIYAKAQGGLPWLAVAGAVLGFDLGSYIGARMANRLSEAKLKRVHSLVLLAMVAMMAAKMAVGG